MRQIKIILISLYIIILGFIVFGNTSVFADTATQIAVFETSSSFDDYFINCQEYFDFCMVNNQHRAGWGYMFNQMTGFYRSWGAYAEPKDDFQNHGRGWLLYVYSNNASMFTSNSQFVTATLPNYWGNGVNMTYKALKMNSSYIAYIYNDGADYIPVTNRNIEFYLPLCCLNYPHTYFQLYKMNTNTSGATTISNAINNQTNRIANETQKQTNAITTATKEQTNALLDTNDTGNDTMSVNDTTTDTSADLGGLFNQISGAFTDTSEETQKGFDLKLPNR